MEVFKEYGKCLKTHKKDLVLMYLRACGIESEPGTQVTWEQFLKINCILKYGSLTDAEYTEFFVKVFDPYDQGFVPKK